MAAGLIVALDKIWDHNECDSLEGLLWDMRNVAGFKVTAAGFLNGLTTTLVPFMSAMEKATGNYYDLLVDFKIADVGVEKDGQWVGTNKEIVESITCACRATHLTVHGFPGEFSVKETVAAAQQFGVECLLLSSMTHAGSKQFMPFPSYLNSMIEMAEKCNTFGFIAPGNDYEFLTTMVDQIKSRFSIWSPGFGRQATLRGGEKIGIDEQIKRWKQIVESGNRGDLDNRIIVGSYIINDDEPGERVAEINQWLAQ